MLRSKNVLLALTVFLVLYEYQIGLLLVDQPTESISRAGAIVKTNAFQDGISSNGQKDAGNTKMTLRLELDLMLDSEIKHCTDLLKYGRPDALKSYRAQPDETQDKEVLEMLSSGCDAFKHRYTFLDKSVYQSGEEERNFPISYSIVVHRQLHQISMLLSAIYRTQNLYCLHVDSKSDATFKQGTEMLAGCFENIFISTKTEKVVYASFSRLQADVNCMRDLLYVPKTMYDWMYLINLCGQDFPLSTNHDIVRQLKKLRGKNSIAGTRELNTIARDRTRFIHRLTNDTQNNRIEVQTNEKHDPPPYNMTLIKNLAYNAFSRDFLQWALLDSEEGAALLNWSSFTHTPDEHFWGMLNAYPGAPGGSQHVSWWGVARAIIWKGTKSENECHGYWQRNVCVFGGQSLPWLMQAPHMFVNKVDVTYDATVSTCLRRFLDQRTTGNNSIWNRNKTLLEPPESLFTEL